MKKNILIIGGIATAVLVAIVVTVSIVSKPEAAPANHDATNSDGHHSASTEEIGELIDLTSQTEVNINIKDFKYSQPNIKIKKGTKVTWTNQDTMKHNVMQDHGDSDAPSPDDVDPDVLAGPLLAKGESYNYTFNEVSAAPYHCSPYPYMKGSVTVVE